jgi:hypothetical protein
MLNVNKLHHIDGKYIQQKHSYRPKLCKDCKHFSRTDEVCKMFVAINIINGREEAIKAIDARNNLNVCGYGGVAFEGLDKKKNKQDVIVTKP